MLPDSGVTLAPGSAAAPEDDDVARNAPEEFRSAVHSLLSTSLRREAVLERIRPPQRLAPWSFAISVDIDQPRGASDEDSATGRLVVLFDPDGHEAWDGELRLVAYAQADLAADMAGDPLLPAVGWSWLTEALQARGAAHTAVGGTVTQTTSTRFGDVHGPSSTTQLELRGSWTATAPDLSAHLLAFVDLLSAAAGLPPEGVAVLGDR